jgi:hypothetical protein
MKNNPAGVCTSNHPPQKNILLFIDIARWIPDEMNRLHPSAMLITDSIDENNAGKSWLVRVRPEAHK